MIMMFSAFPVAYIMVGTIKMKINVCLMTEITTATPLRHHNLNSSQAFKASVKDCILVSN
jgi:hypothetical protein